MATTGGRFGAVIPVLNLNTSGAGSFKYAVEDATGPRVAWIRVSGTLAHQYTYTVTDGDLTIYVDPAERFQLADGARLVIAPGADNVILYNLRIRPGANTSGISTPLLIGDYSGTPVQNVAVLNCSFGYNANEAISIVDAQYVTIQDCILGPGLSTINEGQACLIDGDAGANYVTMLRSVLAGKLRMPRWTGNTVQVVNNVTLARSTDVIEALIHDPPIISNVVGNVAYANGEWVSGSVFLFDTQEKTSVDDRDGCRIYAADNLMIEPDDGEVYDHDLVNAFMVDGVFCRPSGLSAVLPAGVIRDTENAGFPTVTTVTAQAAKTSILTSAGPVGARDALDAWTLAQLQAHTLTQLATVDENGIGYPSMT